MSSGVAVERGIGILGMGTPIEVDHANVERVFIQNDQSSGALDQLHGSMLTDLLQCRTGSAGLITNAIGKRPCVFRGEAGFEGRRLLGTRLGVELPEDDGVYRVSNLQHPSRAVWIPTSGEVRMTVGHTGRGPAGRQFMHLVEASGHRSGNLSSDFGHILSESGSEHRA